MIVKFTTISLYFQVRAEDADVLIMPIHHSSSTNHPLFLTTSKGSYNVRRIRESLCERQRRYLLFCHAFTGCDTVSAIGGHGKTTLFDRFCAGDIDEHMDIFLDVQATKDVVIRGGIAIFQYIYHANQRLYLQQRVQLHSILSVPISKPRLDAAAEHVFGPQRLWMEVMVMSQFQH